MRSSTVEREKLLNGYSLLFIAGLFAMAFAILLPSENNFIGGQDDQPTDKTVAVDALELAYLRAGSNIGEQPLDEVTAILVRLIDAGQYERARSLLSDYPALTIDDIRRFRLELEQIASALTQKSSGESLATLLRHLLETPALHELSLLLRASQLSVAHEQHTLAALLYQLLASVSTDDNSLHWYEQCGEYAIVAVEVEIALNCWRLAVSLAQDPVQKFSFKIKLLYQLGSSEHAVAQLTLIEEMLAQRPLTVAQLEALSSALLAVERPDKAVESYARLATKDEPNRAQWLGHAARWAVASNQGERALDLLSEARKLAKGDAVAEIDQQVENILIARGDQSATLRRTEAQLAQNPNDIDALQAGVRLAQQLGDIPRATEWNTELLAQDPENLLAMRRQIDLHLANASLHQAKLWATRAVAAAPENRDIYIKLAQLSEWTADPYTAVEHWQHVNLLQADYESLSQLERLAQLTLQPGIAADALQQRFKLPPLTAIGKDQAYPADKDVQRLIELHESSGRPDLAAKAVEEVIVRYGVSRKRLKLLATLYTTHSRLRQAQSVWVRFESVFGRSNETLLTQIEIHWQLNEIERAANLSDQLDANILPTITTDHQLEILSEIAWRYRKQRLTLLTASRLTQLEARDGYADLGRRVLVVLRDLKRLDEAVVEADKLWVNSHDSSFALTAMNIRLARGDSGFPEKYTAQSAQTMTLHQIPQYWIELAAMQLRQSQFEQAEAAYQHALSIDPKNRNALSGLLWMHIGRGNQDSTALLLTHHQNLALNDPQMWPAFAVGYLQVGDADSSVLFFEKMGSRIDADYAMLLLYSDALALAGQADKAMRLRLYALQKLRPLLANGSRPDHALLLQQYARLLSVHGSAQEQEQLTEYLLENNTDPAQNVNYWREDMAIAWLMSTQRHEHARVIMAQLHQRRLTTPVWQEMALALKERDQLAIQSILDLGGPVSVGNRVLALRTLGEDQQALALARQSNKASSVSERHLLRDQYASLRSTRPSFAGSTVNSVNKKSLSFTEFGFSAWHTLALSNIGVSVNYRQRFLDSSLFNIDMLDKQSDLAVALHYSKRFQSSKVTAGFISAPDAERFYVSGLYFRQSPDGRRKVSTEVAYNEAATSSSYLQVAGKRNRASFGIDTALGSHEFLSIQLDAREIRTRVTDKKVARGLQARVEFGYRGTIGSKFWSASVAADSRKFNRVNNLPEELMLSPETSFDSVLSAEATSLSIGASLARGEVNSRFPLTSSPRYYVNTRLAHTWPDNTFGLLLDVGAGIRLLGGDELSCGLSYEAFSSKPTSGSDNGTSIGVNYRYHF